MYTRTCTISNRFIGKTAIFFLNMEGWSIGRFLAHKRKELKMANNASFTVWDGGFGWASISTRSPCNQYCQCS